MSKPEDLTFEEAEVLHLTHTGGTAEDQHRLLAAQILDVAPDKVTGNQRRHAKAVNFAFNYGR